MELMKIILTKDKTTKNKIRFAVQADKPTPIQSVYLEKWYAGAADSIQVTIGPVEG